MNNLFKKSTITLGTTLLLFGSSLVMAESVIHDHRTSSITHDHRTTNVSRSDRSVSRPTITDHRQKQPRKVNATETRPTYTDHRQKQTRKVRVTRTHPPREAYKTPPVTNNISELKIPASILTGVINNQLNGIKIHLDNYGKRRGNTWYKGGGSYVKLPKSLGGSQYKFDLPPTNKIPFRYYVNDINLSSIKIGTYKNRFVAKFNLEENGTEVKGRCAGGGVKKIACIKGSDSAAPDVHMKKMIASVYLTPAVRNGSLSFSNVSTDFTADIRIGKTCKVLKALKVGNICSSIEKEIKKGVKTAMHKSLDNNNIRNAIANALRKELSKQGVKKILSAKIEGGMVVVRYRS